MNAAKLKALFTKNRVALGALGVAAVAALAWRARTSTGGDAGTASDVYQPAGTATNPSYYTATGAYDSTATDIYNAIQPQLEELREIADRIPVPGKETTPDTGITTNQSWLSSAIKGWADAGKNPLDIQAALTQYVNGQPVNVAQTAGINWAIKKYGAAPEGTTGVSKVVNP